MTTIASIGASLVHGVERQYRLARARIAPCHIDDPAMYFSLYGAASPDEIGNWHSPVLAWLWDLPGPVIGQPAGALLIQAALFAAYAGFMPTPGSGIRDAASRTVELVWRFMLTGTFGTIGKDVMLLGLLLVLVQLLRCSGGRRFGFAHGFSLACVIATTLTIKAPNIFLYLFGAALVLPFFARSVRPYLALAVAGAVVAPVVVSAVRTIDQRVFLAADRHPDQQIVLFDLAGMSTATGVDQFADIAGWPAQELPPVARCFVPHQWDAFAPWRPGPCSGYSRAYDRLDSQMLRHWSGAVLTHPIAYLGHRLTFARHLVTTVKHDDWGAGGSALNRADVASAVQSLHDVAARRRFARPIQPYRGTIGPLPARWIEWRLFRSPLGNRTAVFGSIPLLAVVWFRRRRGIRLGVVLPAALASANLLMLLFFGVSDEGRYLLPGMALFYTAVLAWIAPGRRQPDGTRGDADRPIATAP